MAISLSATRTRARSAFSDQFDPAVVRYGQQPNQGLEAKHEGSPNAPYATDR